MFIAPPGNAIARAGSEHIIQEWQQTGRDDSFLLRGSLLDEARLWLSRRSNDLTPAEKEFINASLNLQHRERANRAIGRFELLVDSSGSEPEKQHAHSVGVREAERLAKDLPFLARPGTRRVQINVIPVPATQAHNLRSRFTAFADQYGTPVTFCGSICRLHQ